MFKYVLIGKISILALFSKEGAVRGRRVFCKPTGATPPRKGGCFVSSQGLCRPQTAGVLPPAGALPAEL